MSNGIKSTPATLDPLISEARQRLARAVTDLVVNEVKALPAHLQNDTTFAELHLAVIWQMTHAMVGASIANIDSCRNACSMGVHDGIRTNAQLKELAKQAKGTA